MGPNKRDIGQWDLNKKGTKGQAWLLWAQPKGT